MRISAHLVRSLWGALISINGFRESVSDLDVCPTRAHVVDELNRLGYRELAVEASRDLPDPVDSNRLETWCMQHGLTQDEVMSRMGGSP
jgi:hypothetical protein